MATVYRRERRPVRQRRCRRPLAPAVVALGALLLVAPPVAGQSTDPQAPAAPGARCTGNEHRAFDFWVGAWEVADSAGRVVGTNEIRRISDGCALLESWRSARGSTGHSINMYDASTGAWHQVWVGGDGVVLRLTSELADGAMLLAGRRDTPNGPVHDRIRWTPLPDGRVEQRWETSADGGRTWRLAFLGFYSRR